MLIIPAIISLIVGYARNGRLANFEYTQFKLWYLLSVAFLIQFLAINLQIINDTVFYILHVLSYVIIMYVAVLNRHLLSMWFFGIGNLFNALVIAMNYGKMPVKMTEKILVFTSGEPYFDRGHMMMTEATRLKIFADLFVLDVPGLSLSVFSIGDVFLVIGAFLLIQKGMLAKSEAIE